MLSFTDPSFHFDLDNASAHTNQIIDLQYSIVKCINSVTTFVYGTNSSHNGTILRDCQLKVLLSKTSHLVDFLLLDADRNISSSDERSEVQQTSSSNYMNQFTESFGDDLDRLRRGENSFDQEKMALLIDSIKQTEHSFYFTKYNDS